MKKRISLLLVLALIISLVPMSAFAASDNYVNGPAKAKKDANLTTMAVPVLNIENDKGNFGHEETVTLTVKNGDWLGEDDTNYSKNPTVRYGADPAFANDLATEIENLSKKGSDTVIATVYRRSDSRIELTVKAATVAGNTATEAPSGTKIAKDLVLQIPMWVIMDGELAEVQVDSKTDRITEGTYKIGSGSTGDTTVWIEGTKTFSKIEKIKDIFVEENSVGALSDFSGRKHIKLKLNKDFKFDISAAKVQGSLVASNGTLAEITKDGSGNVNGGNCELSSDKEELRIYITNGNDLGAIKLQNSKYAEKLEITGLKVNPGKDAKEGKVNISFTSNVTEIESKTLEIGEYADYKVNINADGEPKEVFSGRYETNIDPEKKIGTGNTVDLATDLALTSDEAHELQKLIIDEKVKGAWTNDKSVTITFPSWVKILSVKRGEDYNFMQSADIDKNEYEFNMGGCTDNDKKKKLELTFYVSVEGGKEGDIEAIVSGRALDKEEKVVLGKAVSPVKVEGEVAKIKAGVRDQEIGKITMTEVKAGAIQEDKNIVLELDTDMDWDDEPVVKVTKGDLEIDEDDIKIDKNDKNVLIIPVDRESTQPSTIEITKSRVKVDRAIAEGSIKVEVKGNAIMANSYDKDAHENNTKKDLLDDYGFFNNNYYAKVEVANVITPADQNTTTAEAVKFVIGNAEYQVGETVETADVAPYIKDGRTMLSLSTVAKALGVPQENILWDGNTRTVTIRKGNVYTQVVIGSNILKVGAVEIPMDTVAEIKEGRTCLPVSYVATALGAKAEWDGATRTVTIK
ncbi:copper amine oxidase N-terminal domain-containing protein [Marinisporobacter balticus]|uniref:Copper amine oxidase-like protein n=1 Tax=Marinisporobacter balticus TaxID=2018667 RepID=A0A4R2L480_9FIRM|nr:copper amine oxidase N-terminal domain-containing protein [Marinisporobacter balticus]TCO78769.1 copper amine oxidase-like protein [Marinisporobacter balticus]